MLTRLQNTHHRVTSILARLHWLPLLAVRIMIGCSFYLAGKGKLFVSGLDSTADYFESIDIPMPYLNAVLASVTEWAGGILLMLGLGTRIAALMLAFTMYVALITAHKDDWHLGLDLVKQLTEVHAAEYLVVCLVLVIFGGGKVSLDHLIKTKFGKPHAR